MTKGTDNALVILGCSATKFASTGSVPAVHLYDGPMYRVLRAHLRDKRWPSALSLGVLSAKYGFIGGVAPIRTYEQRMTAQRAAFLKEEVGAALDAASRTHRDVHLILGKDYLQAIDIAALANRVRVHRAEGPIGLKLHHFSNLLGSFKAAPRIRREPREIDRPLYFLPDWDDFLDQDFDFSADRFSADRRSERKLVHSTALMRPRRVCDGILVSLAQHLGTKGLLRRLPPADPGLFRPRSVREFFGLAEDQWAFGDCGAFSYVNEHNPTITVDQAVAVYELYEFDLGASVDHIPLEGVVNEDGKRKALSLYERRRRISITRDNAHSFIQTWRAHNCRFTPVGIIQALTARGYAAQVHEYVEMGYRHVALGGLVPRTDEEIAEIVRWVQKAAHDCSPRPWIHLLGIYRPRLQSTFRELGVNSFDSATYFRKAWLRTDQNYIGADGKWYAAIRVPPSADPRTLARLKVSGASDSEIRNFEQEALDALRRYATRNLDVEECLEAVVRYDRLLNRGDFPRDYVREQYRRTLNSRPWEACDCSVCTSLGVETLIFRGYNRNKRRGAHNTLRLFEQLKNVQPKN